MIEINKQVFESIVLGSSIYSTGGGLEYSAQLKMFSRLQDVAGTKIVSAKELDNNLIVCAAYGVGSAGSSNVKLDLELKNAKILLEEYTGKRIGAVFSGETNIDVLVIGASIALDLPILDADCTGGRAVPEIQFDNFFVKKHTLLPLAASAGNKSIIIYEAKHADKIDAMVRKLATQSKSGSAGVLDHLVSVGEAEKLLTHGIFARSLATGEFVKRNRGKKSSMESLAKIVNGRIVANGRVSEVSLVDDKRQGFLVGFYNVECESGETVTVYVKNENIMCWINKKAVILPPDSILTIDTKSLYGVHNSKIKKGQHVSIISKRAEGLWNTATGRSIFNYRKFGLKLNLS